MNAEMIHVIVQTCDKYSSVIPKWLTFFYRHWMLPHRVTILGETRGSLRAPVSLRYNPVTAFYYGRDVSWASNLLLYLSHIGDEPFLLMMDDYIVFDLNEELISSAWDIIHRDDVGCVRLVPWPGPTLPYDVEGFGEIDKTQEYAISLQASFFKPKVFKDLLDRSWSPWQVELDGSRRSANYPLKFIGCKTCAINYKEYFERGHRRAIHADWVDANL